MPVTLRHFLFLGVVACIVTIICVPLAKRIALRFDAIDYPCERRVNKEPTPRLGGIAMCMGVAAALAIEYLGEAYLGWAGFYVDQMRTDVDHSICMIGLFLVALVGAIDDVKQISAKWKLLGQIFASAVIASSGLLLDVIMNPFTGGYFYFGWFAYPLTIFYLVIFMNVINLIDGLDGLAAGIVAIAAFWLFVIAFGKGLVETAMLSIVLLGVSVGFLKHNYHPASIFMGDCGSLMLGTMLGIISLLGVMRSPTFVLLAVPFIIAAIPMFDTLAAIVRRAASHRSIMSPDKGHLHHALLGRGYSTRKSVNIIYVWTFTLGLGAYLISSTHGMTVFFVFSALVAISFAILWHIGILEPVLRHHYHHRHGSADNQNEERSDS